MGLSRLVDAVNRKEGIVVEGEARSKGKTRIRSRSHCTEECVPEGHITIPCAWLEADVVTIEQFEENLSGNL